MTVAIGIDLGGTELRAAVVSADGEVLAHVRTETAARDGPAAVVSQMAELVGRIAAGHDVRGVGIGSPGPLDAEAGVVVHASTLLGWNDVPLAALAEARLGLPVRIDNDANVAALAEWRFGAGRGLRHMVYVTVSTGIGGGVILDGKLMHGRRSMAGEFGHMTITEAPVLCTCGAFGCWEALASGPALGQRATELGTLGRVTARDVARLAKAGDATALGLLAEEARYLGLGFANLLHLYAPEMIVVGGGVSDSLPAMQADIEAVIRRQAMPTHRDVPIVAAALGQRAGVIGAALLVLPEP
ncbi:ROK family protein [Acidisoma sp.]|uniref:ROK family protein n=1 Tax=Acidisoma sp. TaxID=1872115 RepID=UPI003B0064DD